MDTKQLESFGNVTQMFFGLGGQMVTVHMTNSSLTADGELCHAITFRSSTDTCVVAGINKKSPFRIKAQTECK